MDESSRTYVVGRQNNSTRCDIEVPAGETSVSRRHLELTIGSDGSCYVVHLHTRNKTKVLRGGEWCVLSEEYVELDAPLRLGKYETSARRLLDSCGEISLEPQPPAQNPSLAEGSNYQWDPESGTIVRRRPH